MSEAVGKPRQSVNLDEFERRLRAPEPTRVERDDPLAELARLVESGDVFERSPRQAPPQQIAQPQAQPLHHEPVQQRAFAHEEIQHPANAVEPERVPSEWDAEIARVSEPARLPPMPEHFDAAPFRVDPPRQAEPQYASQPQPDAYVQQDFPQELRAATPEADYAAWRDEGNYAPPPPPVDDFEPAPQRSRKAVYAMSGAVAFVVLGIGATFALKSGPASNREAPMIKAASGPTKVQPETTGSTPTGSTQAASVLDKGGDKVGASRVVGSVEQPVDVAAQARSVRQPNAPSAATAAAGGNIFPEPKRVKTVSVRPDGSIVGADIPVATTPSASAVPAPPTRGVPAVQPSATATPPVAARPAPTPPKATTRVAARTDVQADADDDAPKPTAARPVVRPKPAAETKPAADGKVAGGGAFAVQLASGGTDAEAREKANRVRTQYGSALGGRSATVVKGEANGKTVYRVRVVGLTQENATALCVKIKGSGGDCFVAR